MVVGKLYINKVYEKKIVSSNPDPEGNYHLPDGILNFGELLCIVQG